MPGQGSQQEQMNAIEEWIKILQDAADTQDDPLEVLQIASDVAWDWVSDGR